MNAAKDKREYEYPYIENADEKLKDLCTKGLDARYKLCQRRLPVHHSNTFTYFAWYTGCRDPELRQQRDPSYRIRRHRQLQDHRNVYKQQGADIKEIIEVDKKN